MERGYLALVLHAHLPYVRHAGRDDTLEERWFFEALTECYIPLLQVFEKLVADGVDFRITLSLTPTLLAMLDDELLLARYEKHLRKLLELAEKEVTRTKDDPAFHELALHYRSQFRKIFQYADEHNFRIIPRFRKLQELGKLELIACAATHGFLPLMTTEEAIRAQIALGVEAYARSFGVRPQGIWLPECGYAPGVDRILAEAGIRYFFVESHAIEHAYPDTPYGLHAPVFTPNGVAAFGRDRESSRQVWSSIDGYPGDYDYREYYRDIGFDLPEAYIEPYILPQGIRVNTGFKYYRITGNGKHKEPYNLAWAREKAARHAGNFMFNREKQAEYLAAQMDRKPVVVAPYDAELFGHWWYEGPLFIDFLCRKVFYDQQTIRMVTPSEYLDEYPVNPVAQLPTSSWGRNGYAEVWLQGNNSWIYRHLHKAEYRLVELAEKFANGSPLQQRALKQAARELLLAQSSDWAFIMDQQTTVDYAVKRTKMHISRFTRLYDALLQNVVSEEELARWEAEYPIFPNINMRVFLPSRQHKVAVAQDDSPVSREKRRILMLAWEYPPKVVGGLARAVYDLSRALAAEGEEVHVLTSAVADAPRYETMNGVHVHRLSTYLYEGAHDFFDWIFQLNLAIVDHVEQMTRKGYSFHVIHAHDWLVGYAARQLKRQLGLPLVVTIHATEYGRNQGIYTDLQRKIHQEERQLTHEAQKVIVCSRYMKEEVQRVLQLPSEKIERIPNGVDPEQVRAGKAKPPRAAFALPDEKIVFFVGRMVREKGVHLLLQAVPAVLRECPEAKFVLAGKGPMLDGLKRKAEELGIAAKVLFTGFIDDGTRNALFHYAYVSVFPSLYEPFGIVALEAMAAGGAVIAADTGGLREMIEHRGDGLTFYAGNPQSLADQLIAALRDPSLIAACRRRGREKVMREYEWSAIARRTREIYQQLHE
ncbi:hypothetical protein BSNK01_14760 [Bacillaceae bacterium]